MLQLFNEELKKALRNKWFAIALAIGCVFALYYAAPSVWSAIFPEPYTLSEDKFYFNSNWYVGWMSLTASGYITEVFYQVIPLIVLIPYACSWAGEQKSGYLSIVYASTDRARYLTAKYVAVFCSAGIVAVVPQIVHALIMACLLSSATPDIIAYSYIGISWNCLWSWWLYNVPVVYVALYCLLDFVVCGLWAGFVFSLSLYVRNRTILIAFPYVGLLILQYINENLFFALGKIRGIEFSLFENLRAANSMYLQNGWVIAALGLITATLSFILLARRKSRDVL